MTDRDTFAAAALTGLLARTSWRSCELAETAYRYADAMIVEQKRSYDAQHCDLSEDQKSLCNAAGILGPGGFSELAKRLMSISRRLATHDAAPAARATTKPGGLNSGSASGTSGDSSPVTTPDCGTGDTQEPVAFGVWDEDGFDGAFLTMDEVRDWTGGDYCFIVPLYRHPQPTLTDAEREAVEVALVWVNPERQDTLRGLLERTQCVQPK